ncbi:putative leucine-rich repeat-containing, plant-type, leucine-rich repeat domain, L [Rosa chinensis]|uniref:Putative leucine-rich repeat-containing, plant-type, leucine-rich repeat domain, L n=1 Tax=Rosa chinensis TaxID=74649 RepID=A0A2P6SFB5_ROSCH|nr:receptor-like protein 6 [Rosa chinensis]PRQ57366.1 putative leucine-rich repeat-containing, plant-type, leucine-rich repeat domain, L [Rosa chinensis]
MGFSMCALSKLVLFLVYVVVANSFSPLQSYSCHDEERSALLQFKESLIIDKRASVVGAYPKVSSWKPEEGKSKNCCSWDGVECDEKTGYVIGLDLSSSCLYGSINSSNSLFRLVHLQRLNLADNNFNYSQIPTGIRNFPMLSYLNLSASVFFGEVPSEVSQLSKLSFLDLSFNVDVFTSTEGLLKLRESNFRSLVQNLTSLEKLHLSLVNISSTIPDSMANLSFLSSLLLRGCDLFGAFPVGILKLQNLETLDLKSNQYLTGYLPEFHPSSSLMSLKLGGTSFSGNLSSIEKLDSLKELEVQSCNFSGPIVQLANLTQLTYLALSNNNFTGGSLSWIGKLTKITYLRLENINLSGYIPSSFRNLTQLFYLHVHYNQLTGPIPSWIGNLSSLAYIDLSSNRLHGSIPDSIFNLIDLQILFLHENSLHGTVDILKLQSTVTHLQLSVNKFNVVTESRITNATFPNFSILGLCSCNIKEFPYFLRYQQNLFWLDLSSNKLQGHVPKWVWNMSTEALEFIDISRNFLSGFEQPLPAVLPWVKLQILWLSNNKLHGSLPIPHPNILYYAISDNEISGELPPLICNLNNLQYLDLANNKLSGTLPRCLGNFSDDLQALDLGNNSFHGILPQTYSTTSKLGMINVRDNKLQGDLPRSLANCVMLEFLDLSNNEFSDAFPFWLGALQELKLLAMNHNAFYGLIGTPEKKLNFSFPKLRILDLSYNKFTGEFPSKYIFSGNSLRGITLNQSTYMDTSSLLQPGGSPKTFAYDFSAMITTKGVDRYYPRIQEDFAAVDLSSNRFEGKIPDFIGNLKGLHSLNISNNILTGRIPASLGNLIQLESLDLSQNKLSGEIPQQLTQIPSLGTFKVSNNNLTGSIPQGQQFNTFDSSSYEGNPGLCGDPLPKKCGNPKAPQPSPSTKNESDSGSGVEVDWKFVLAGFGSGLLVGVVLADVLITRRPESFIMIVEICRTLVEGRGRPRKQNRRYIS